MPRSSHSSYIFPCGKCDFNNRVTWRVLLICYSEMLEVHHLGSGVLQRNEAKSSHLDGLDMNFQISHNSLLLCRFILKLMSRPSITLLKKITGTLKQHNVTPSQSHFCEIKLSTSEVRLIVNKFHMLLCKWNRQQVEIIGN